MRLHFQIKQKSMIFQFLQCHGGLLFFEHVPINASNSKFNEPNHKEFCINIVDKKKNSDWNVSLQTNYYVVNWHRSTS